MISQYLTGAQLMLGQCLAFAQLLLSRCLAIAFPLLTPCLAVAQPLLSRCLAVAQPLLSHCLAIAQPLLSPRVCGVTCKVFFQKLSYHISFTLTCTLQSCLILTMSFIHSCMCICIIKVKIIHFWGARSNSSFPCMYNILACSQ